MSNVIVQDAFGTAIYEGDEVVFFIGTQRPKEIYQGVVVKVQKMVKVKVTKLPVNQQRKNAHITHNLGDEVWAQYYRTVVI